MGDISEDSHVTIVNSQQYFKKAQMVLSLCAFIYKLDYPIKQEYLFRFIFDSTSQKNKPGQSLLPGLISIRSSTHVLTVYK